jgi:two-component system sensor histidine kinase KdpD
MAEDRRPDPDALLAEAKKEGRGRLKIFIGAAPGVGKTYAMLQAARASRRAGVDVVAGVVESHGRRETERLLIGLDVLPRRVMAYRGRSLPELDLDGLLARRPQLALVDELAHTNVPGSRHPKRWQDVEELLAAGTDVYSTLNVQHLESLNDVVERIAGVKVRETVPDAILERADEIEVVDISPEDLQRRLRDGKVYVPETAARAVNRFFSRGNLTALRELALRAAAERVDRDLVDHLRAHGQPGGWHARDRVLVCVGGGPDAERLVRVGKRMADRAKAPWLVAHLQDERVEDDSADRALALAETLGADTEALSAAGSPAETILELAARRNVTRIVVGRGKGVWGGWLGPPLHEQLIRGGGAYEIVVVGRSAVEAVEPGPFRTRFALPALGSIRPHVLGLGFVALSIPAALAVDAAMPLANLSLVFMAPVLATAALGRIGASLTTSVAAFLAYNFFFTEPRFTLHVIPRDELLTLGFFFVVSVVVGVLGARLRQQVDAMRASARQTRALYDFTRRALTAATDYDMAWSIVSHVNATLQLDAVLMRPDSGGELAVVAGAPPIDEVDPSALAAADWAWRNAKAAGWGTDTLPGAAWLFLPLVAGERALGVLGVARREGVGRLAAADRRLLDTLADQAALILDRGTMMAEAAEAQRYSQTEKLRTALLSSVSHDLRTPLVGIMGAASSLQSLGDRMAADDRAELLGVIAGESERLNRFIQNLLDMTRLGYGGLTVRREWLDVADIVAAARERLARRLRGNPVRLDIRSDASLVHADPTLLEQALVNLLDNAARHSPPGAEIIVNATAEGGRIALAVCDHGPGVPPHRRDRVFDMFYRMEGGDGVGAGTGLGLAIVRGFVEAMGGRVRVGEADGGGARFVIDLPQPAQPRLSPEPADA